jgi:pimeloyl-ACP methyl ester carboxylesterase
MADFLLIHGSCHGAWCWRDLIPELNALGHNARAIDLPGHGGDVTPISDITLQSYVDAILSAIRTPVVLVGHSMAGFPISLAVEQAPDKISRLIYLCAYVPEGTLTLAEMRRRSPEQPLVDAIVRSEDRKSFWVDPAQVEKTFYHDCPEGTVAYANIRLCPQPILPQDTPCPLGKAYASVPRSYIRCTDDRTIPPAAQVEMTQGWPERDVFELPTGHSPFFADPKGLAALLHRIAG